MIAEKDDKGEKKMGMKARRRWRILLTVMIVMGISLGTILVARFLNLGSNTQDPLYFDSRTHSQFLYDNGTHVVTLDFDSIPIDSTRTNCTISLDGQVTYFFNVTPDGRYVDPTIGETQNNTPFWIHIVEAGSGGSETTEQVGRDHSIFDPIGILGAPDTEYVMTVTAKYVYWAERPSLHGAQFSLKFVIRDLNGLKIAEGEMDFTCGMLFVMDIGNGNLKTLELTETNYDISRNRLTGWPVAIIGCIAAPVLVFCYLHFRKKEPLEQNLETSLLIALGCVGMFLVDFMIDIWMYAPLGLAGCLILHSAVVAGFAAYAIWRKLGLKWTIPGVLEILFVGVITAVTGDSYVPHLTAFMGLTVTFLCFLWASGVRKIESDTKKGKIIAEFL